jgi:hypothetical protein
MLSLPVLMKFNQMLDQENMLVSYTDSQVALKALKDTKNFSIGTIVPKGVE